MKRSVRLALGLGLAVASMAALGALTRFAYTAEPRDEAELRLTWRARAPLVEECRQLTESERDALPVHMRRDEICEGRVASYRLDVVVDGEVRHRSTVRGAGARGDRPLYVNDSMRLRPGSHEVVVIFERADVAVGTTTAGPDARAGAVPDRLMLERRIELAAGDVALVTYDATERRLVLRQRPDER